MNTSKTVLKIALMSFTFFACMQAASKKRRSCSSPTEATATTEHSGDKRPSKRGGKLTPQEGIGEAPAPSAVVPAATAAAPAFPTMPGTTTPKIFPDGPLTLEQITDIQQAVASGRTVHIPGAGEKAAGVGSASNAIELQRKIAELNTTITALQEALTTKDTELARKDELLQQATTKLDDALLILEKMKQKATPGFIRRHTGKLLVMCITVLYLSANYDALATLTIEDTKRLLTTCATHTLFGYEVSIPVAFVSFINSLQRTWTAATAVPSKLAEAYHFVMTTLGKITPFVPTPTPTPTPLPTVKSGMRCLIQ